MTEYASELARDVEPRDRFAKGIQDALMFVVHQAALGVRNDWPHLRGRKRRLEDRHHAAGGAVELRVDTRGTSVVPPRDGRGEATRIEPEFLGDGFKARSRHQHLFVKFAQRIFAEASAEPGIAVDRLAERIKRAPLRIDDEDGGNSRIALGDRIVQSHRPMVRILHIGIVFIHEPLAVLVDDDPAHRIVMGRFRAGYPIAHAADADAEFEVRVRVMKSVDPVVVPHMPEPCAGLLTHADSIAGVAKRGNRAGRWCRPELALHFFG